MKRAVIVTLVTLVVAAAPAYALTQTPFPRLRIGTGIELNAGGGVVAGTPYAARSAVVAWNRRWNSLTLYLLSRPSVMCATLRSALGKPGHLVQVYVTGKPHVYVGRPISDPAVAFVTVFSNPKTPEHVSGLKHGAKLTFSRVDSYPGGVWYGVFKVPTRIYGDGKVYGYNATFAAKWCELLR